MCFKYLLTIHRERGSPMKSLIILSILIISFSSLADEKPVTITLFNGETVDLKKDVKVLSLSMTAPNRIGWVELNEGTLRDPSVIVEIENSEELILQAERNRQLEEGSSRILRATGGDGSGG